MRVSACSFAAPFSTPLEHRETVRTTRGRIVRLGKRTGYRLNSFLYGLLKVFISPLLAGPQGRCQLWARNLTKSPTWWPTFPGVGGVHEDNGASGIYPGLRRSGRQPPLVCCASARIDTRRFCNNQRFLTAWAFPVRYPELAQEKQGSVSPALALLFGVVPLMFTDQD
jgi:hypothetical protein